MSKILLSTERSNIPDLKTPTHGSAALHSVNRKEELGRIPLSSALPMVVSLSSIFRFAGVGHAPIGSSAFGVTIKVTPDYLEKRRVSTIIDFCVERISEDYLRILTDAGWKQINPSNYFSVTFAGEDGRRIIVPTVRGQHMFERDNFLLNLMPIPTEYYQVKGGLIEIAKFTEMPTAADVVVRKLIKQRKKDREDIANIAHVESLATVLGSKVETVKRELKEIVAENPDAARVMKGQMAKIAKKVGNEESAELLNQFVEHIGLWLQLRRY